MISTLVIAFAIIAAALLLRGRMVNRRELARLSDAVWPIPVLNPSAGDRFTPESFTINEGNLETTVYFGQGSSARVDRDHLETIARRDAKHERDKAHAVARRHELRAAHVQRYINNGWESYLEPPITAPKQYEAAVISGTAARVVSKERLDVMRREVDDALSGELRKLDDHIETMMRRKAVDAAGEISTVFPLDGDHRDPNTEK